MEQAKDLKLYKWQGLGNDFIILVSDQCDPSANSDLAVKLCNYEDYEIPPTDIFDGLDTEWYFGLAIVRGSTVYWMTNSTAGNMSVTAPVAGYTDTVFTTGTAQVFTFISQRRKPSFNSSAEGPTKFYALPMGDIRPMSIKSSSCISFDSYIKPQQ